MWLISNLEMIPVPSIDLTSESSDSYIVTFPRDWSPVRESMHVLGCMLQPPVLVPGYGQNIYHVVCGYKRIRAAIDLGWENIEARVLDLEQYTRAEIFKISVADNMFSGGLNPVEKSIALHRFQSITGQHGVSQLENLCLLLGIPPSEEVINQYLALDQLGNGMKMALAKGDLTINQAQLFLQLNEDDRNAVFSIVNSLKCNSNEIRIIVEGFQEIAKKRGTTESEITRDLEIIKICSGMEISARERTIKLMDHLHGLRYPYRTRFENEFEAERKKMHLPNYVQITPSPYFEGNWLCMSAKFSNPSQSEELIRKLSLPENKEILQTLFKFVDGSYKI